MKVPPFVQYWANGGFESKVVLQRHCSYVFSMSNKLIIPGKCIYCLQEHDGTREHVIPEALNGGIVLPSATCKECREKINSEIESPLLSFHYKKSRRIHGFNSKNKGAKKKRLPPKENCWHFVIKRSTPPFQKVIPVKGCENLFSDVIYRYNLPVFLSHLHNSGAKRPAIQIHHPYKLGDLDKQERQIRRDDKDIVSIQRQSPIFRRDLVARLVCKMSCGLFAGLFRANSPEQLRSFILEGGSDNVMNLFVLSASRELFPMRPGEAKLFIRKENGERLLYTALNVFPPDIPEVYFVRVVIPDNFDTEELSLDCLKPLAAKTWFDGLRVTSRKSA